MRVFVTGATGFIGSALVQELIGAGHRVLGLARSEKGASALAAAGAEVHRGSLEDLESLKQGAAASDGVVHTAFIHDFSKIAASGATDKLAIDAMGAALAGSERPFVVTSTTTLVAQGRVATEDDAPETQPAVGVHRLASDRAALSLASRGVRVSLVRLPPSVHGDGDYAFVPALIRMARVADEGVPTRDIAQAIARRLNVPVVSKSPEDAAAHFGWLGRFFGLDNPTSSARTRERLGWIPQQPGLIADLEQGRYFEGAT